MTSSLVGSEMCIRDRYKDMSIIEVVQQQHVLFVEQQAEIEALQPELSQPVSYTHLTLPTICSV
eukprot:292657-Prorocentrum_lima.AAC.1